MIDLWLWLGLGFGFGFGLRLWFTNCFLFIFDILFRSKKIVVIINGMPSILFCFLFVVFIIKGFAWLDT